MLLAFRTRVIRSLPIWMGCAFLIAAVGLLISALLKSQNMNLGTILVSSLALAFVWGAGVAPITAYFFRKEERIPARSQVVWRMFVFSLAWSVALGTLGFALLGCSMESSGCLSNSNLSTAFVVAAIIGGVLSMMVLCS